MWIVIFESTETHLTFNAWDKREDKKGQRKCLTADEKGMIDWNSRSKEGNLYT